MRGVALGMIGVLVPSVVLAQTANYHIVKIEDGAVGAVSASSVWNTPEGFRAFRVAVWGSQPNAGIIRGEEFVYTIATFEMLADCSSGRSRPVSAIYFNNNLSEVARENFDEPFEEEETVAATVCTGSAGDFSADTRVYENLAQFADAAPHYLTRAALSAPQMHVSTFESSISQEDCFLRAKDATLEMSNNYGSEIWERKGWYSHFGPVAVTINCEVRGTVTVSVAKPNYAVGNLREYAERVARLMRLGT